MQLIRTPRGNSVADALTNPSTMWLMVGYAHGIVCGLDRTEGAPGR